jgi:hypothetical protein
MNIQEHSSTIKITKLLGPLFHIVYPDNYQIYMLIEKNEFDLKV